jgi:RND superfamily putative drug exporter
MTRNVAGLITGHRTKYLIIVFWLVVVALAGPLAGKLTDVQDNEAKSWLPGGAESTQVLDKQAAFASPDTIPAVVVYERPSGLTDADKAKVAADAQKFGQLAEIDGQVQGPVPSGDGQAAQIFVPLNLGPDGWERAGTIVDSMRETADAGANGLTVHITGPAGQAADSADAFEGIDSTLLASR